MDIKIGGWKAAALSTIFFTLGLLKVAPAFAERMELVTYYSTATSNFDRMNADRATIGSTYRTAPDTDVTDGRLLVSGQIGIGTTSPAAALHVLGPDNAQQNFVVGKFGAGANFRVGIGTLDPQAKLHVVRPLGGLDPTLYLDSYNDTLGNRIGMRRARGTVVAPGNVQSDDVLGRIAFHGLVGTTFESGGAIQFQSTGGWSATSTPAYASFWTTPVDSTDPQERMRITAAGRVGIGTTAPQGVFHAVTRSEDTDNVFLDMYGNAQDEGLKLRLRRAEGTVEAPAAVQSGDYLGVLGFGGFKPSAFVNDSSAIRSEATANWTATSTPSRLLFWTTPSGSTISQERLRITSDGAIQLPGIATSSAPAASPPNQARIYFDSTEDGFRISDNNQTYAPLTPIVVKLKDNWQTDNTGSATDWTTDNRLRFNVGPNERWAFQMYVPYYTVNTDFDIRLTTTFVPNGTNQYWVMAPFKDAAKYHTLACGFNYPGVPSFNCSDIKKLEGSDNNQGLTLLATVVGIIQGDATGGEVVLEWKANKNNRDCGVRDGGYLTAYRQSQLNE